MLSIIYQWLQLCVSWLIQSVIMHESDNHKELSSSSAHSICVSVLVSTERTQKKCHLQTRDTVFKQSY